MKITVKMLQGQECALDVSGEISVGELKELVSFEMNIPKDEQKLLLLGKPLLDDKLLGECGVKEGSKINLIRKVVEKQAETGGRLREAMFNFLLSRMPANSAYAVLEHFMKDFNKSISTLSMDDMERIARTRLQEQGLKTT